MLDVRWQPLVKRAVIYRRASLDQTGEGLAVDRQLEACRGLITMRGWTEVGVETDNSISAYGKKDRPGWNRVLAMMERGEIDVVVAWHLDRMTRSMGDLEGLITKAEKYNVGIATATGDFDLSSDVGRMVARILAAVARAEVERKAARQKLANAQRATSGRPWTGGARPFGYSKDQTEIVEAEAEAIRNGALLALGGVSMRDIARRWEAAGLSSSRASAATKAGWTGRGVKNVLVSPRYAGIRTYLNDEAGPGKWPAILDLETHLALKARLTDPGRLHHSSRSGRTASNLLTGLAVCGVCDGTVNGSANRGTLTYTCRPNAHVAPPRAEADREVEEYLVALLCSENVATRLAPEGNSASDNARQELDALQGRLTVLGESFIEGAVTDARFKDLSRKLTDKIRAAEAALVRSSAGGTLDGISVGTAAAAAQWEQLDLAHKRSIIQALLDVEFLPKGAGGRGDTRAWDPAACLRIALKD